MKDRSAATGGESLLIKVCGLRTPEHLRWVGESGAHLAGLVFAPSRRRVTIAEARAILAGRAGGTPPEVVGVFAGQDAGEVAATAAACALATVQLSGREDPAVTAALVASGLRVIKTIHVAEDMAAGDVLRALEPHVAAGAEAILLDTASREGGGSGRAFDWQVARAVVRGSAVPILLAGGLTPTNVAAAVETARPRGVDVSSGVETGGAKDRAKIAGFVAATARR